MSKRARPVVAPGLPDGHDARLAVEFGRMMRPGRSIPIGFGPQGASREVGGVVGEEAGGVLQTAVESRLVRPVHVEAAGSILPELHVLLRWGCHGESMISSAACGGDACPGIAPRDG